LSDAKEEDMSKFTDFIQQNKDRIRKATNSNSQRNLNGIPVISKDDKWREETEWNEMYKDISKNK